MDAPLDAVSVLIVDDQAPFRSAARTVVTLAPGFEVLGEAETGEEAVATATSRRPGLILMDINLPGISGIEATRQIVAADDTTKVILLSTYTEDDLPADARSCGALAYVHKEDLSPAAAHRAAVGARRRRRLTFGRNRGQALRHPLPSGQPRSPT